MAVKRRKPLPKVANYATLSLPPIDDFVGNFHETVDRYMMQKSVTPLELAEACGITVELLAQYLAGDLRVPVKTLIKISKKLDTSIIKLLT